MLVTASHQSGQDVQVSFDKEALKAISKVANHPTLSNEANWRMVSVVFKHSSSGKRLVSGFKNNFTKTDNVKVKSNMSSGEVYELHEILISGVNRSPILSVKRADIANASSMDLTLSGSNGSGSFNANSVSDIALWLDSADLSLANNAPVISWTDKVGGHVFNSHSNNSNPHYPTFKSSWRNQKPSVNFADLQDGSPWWYQELSMRTDPSPVYITAQMTIFVVGRFGVGSHEGSFRVSSVGQGRDPQLYFTSGDMFSPSFSRWTGGSSAFSATATVNSGNSWIGDSPVYVTARYDGSTSIIRKNGQNLSVTTSGNPQTYPYSNESFRFGPVGTTNLGTTNDADYAEIIIYNRALSDSEIAQVEAYLANKYQI
jgi:hypothetical protein